MRKARFSNFQSTRDESFTSRTACAASERKKKKLSTSHETSERRRKIRQPLESKQCLHTILGRREENCEMKHHVFAERMKKLHAVAMSGDDSHKAFITGKRRRKIVLLMEILDYFQWRRERSDAGWIILLPSFTFWLRIAFKHEVRWEFFYFIKCFVRKFLVNKSKQWNEYVVDGILKIIRELKIVSFILLLTRSRLSRNENFNKEIV